MNLSTLTATELKSVHKAIEKFHAAYDLVALECMDDDDDISTEELAEAVVKEMQRRAIEDAEFKVQRGIKRGKIVPVERPDGEIGYKPTDMSAGWAV